jgi:hypothetical protein
LDDSAVTSRVPIPGNPPDRGREYQGAIWEGNTHLGMCVDLINPTHAAGNFGRNHVPWIIRDIGPKHVAGEVVPYDYCRPSSTGSYRLEHLAGRYPETGWFLKFRYDLIGNSIVYTTDWWHQDAKPRYVDHYVHCLHLWHKWFQRPLVNEAKRIWGSHRDDLIADSHITIDGAGVRIKFDGSPGTFHSYAPNLKKNIYTQAPEGEATFMEHTLQHHIRRMVQSGEVLRMRSVTTFTEKE